MRNLELPGRSPAHGMKAMAATSHTLSTNVEVFTHAVSHSPPPSFVWISALTSTPLPLDTVLERATDNVGSGGRGGCIGGTSGGKLC